MKKKIMILYLLFIFTVKCAEQTEFKSFKQIDTIDLRNTIYDVDNHVYYGIWQSNSLLDIFDNSGNRITLNIDTCDQEQYQKNSFVYYAWLYENNRFDYPYKQYKCFTECSREGIGKKNNFRISPDYNKVACSYNDNRNIIIYNTSSGKYKSYVEAEYHRFKSFTWFPDSSKLAVLSSNNNIEVIIFDTAINEKPIKKLEYPKISAYDFFECSTDSSKFALFNVGSNEHKSSILIFDANTCELIKNLGKFDNTVTSVKWSRDCSKLAASLINGVIIVWDAHAWEVLKVLQESNKTICDSIAWSPDNINLCSIYRNGKLKIWDALKGECLQVSNASLETLFFEWSPDGTKIIIGSAATINIWQEDN